MRLGNLVSIVGLLTILVQAAQAQEPIPSAPWPPENPTAFFADNVEIVSSELRSSAIGSTDDARVDLDRRLVIIEDGRVYPLPQTDRTEFTPEGGPRVVVLANTEVYVANVSNGNEYWKLDLQTGEWIPLTAIPEYLDTFCGIVSWEKLLFVPTWITIAGSSNQLHLCNLRNGNVSPPLPVNSEEWHIDSSVGVADYLLLLPRPAENPSVHQSIYLYNFSTRTFFFIAQIPFVANNQSVFDYRRSVSVQLTDLADNSLLVSIRPNSTTQENSTHDYLFRLSPEQQRVEELNTDFSYNAGSLGLEYWQELTIRDDIACEITRLDLRLDAILTFQTQAPCRANRLNNGDYIYYRRLTENSTSVEIVRFDKTNGESEIVYQGEIEAILWISPDNRHVAFVMDNSQVIDILPGEQDIRPVVGFSAQAVILELATERVMFQSSVFAQEPFLQPAWSLDIYSVTNEYVAIGDGSTTTLIDLSDSDYRSWNIEGRISTEVVDNWVKLPPPRNEVIDEFGAVARMSAYNLRTHQSYPLINLGGYEFYYLAGDFQYLGNDTFEFTVGYDIFPYVDPNPPLYNLITYTVRLQVE